MQPDLLQAVWVVMKVLRQLFLCLRLMKLKVCKERLQRNMDLGLTDDT